MSHGMEDDAPDMSHGLEDDVSKAKIGTARPKADLAQSQAKTPRSQAWLDASLVVPRCNNLVISKAKGQSLPFYVNPSENPTITLVSPLLNGKNYHQ
ncbi:hypothetical protein Lal_00035554 [Lupinus albus]|nr:hypothetical protein Lal_00035554 [Lupinus albus]